jgi:hypothetical protein
VVLPLPAIAGDVVVAAADEVPPHHQLLAERDPAEQQDARRPCTAVGQRDRVVARRLVPEICHAEGSTSCGDLALVE